MVSSEGRRRNKYETHSISYEEESSFSENKSASTTGYTTATATSSEGEIDSKIASESNMTSIAASSGDVSLNSSDIADIVKDSKSKIKGKYGMKSKKSRKKRNNKLDDNYLNDVDSDEEEDEDNTADSEEEMEEEEVVEEQSNISRVSSKASSTASKKSSGGGGAMKFLSRSKKKNKKFTSSISLSSKGSSIKGDSSAQQKQDEGSSMISNDSSVGESQQSSKKIKSKSSMSSAATDDKHVEEDGDSAPVTEGEESSSKESIKNSDNSTNVSSNVEESTKVSTKKEKKRRKKHRDKLKLQTYDYYGEECFELVKTEVPFSDDEENTAVKSKKSNVGNATSKGSDKYADGTYGPPSNSTDGDIYSESSKNKKDLQGNDDDVAENDNEIVPSLTEVREREVENSMKEGEETAREVVETKEDVEETTEEPLKEEVPNRSTATEADNEDEKEAAEEKLSEIATTKTSSKRSKVFNYTKKALLSSTVATKKKLMKTSKTSTSSTSSAEGNSNESTGKKKKKISFGGIMKKSFTNNKHKQKKLTNDKATAVEDVNDDVNEKENTNADDQQEQQPTPEKEVSNVDNKKAVTIVDNKEAGDEKKHVLDEICKDDLTQLVSVLTMSMMSHDDDDDDDSKNPTRIKSTQKDIQQLLKILESQSTTADDNSKDGIIRNRYSLETLSTKAGTEAEPEGDAQVASLIESLKAYKPEEKDDKSNAELSASIHKLSSQLIANETNKDTVDDTIQNDKTPSTEVNNNTDNYVPTSPEVAGTTNAAATLSPIETALADENVQSPSSVLKKKKNIKALSPRKALQKKFVRFKEHLESPRSLSSNANEKAELLYETVKMIIVTASIIIKQSGFDVKSAEEASALMLEEELIKLSASTKTNNSKPWFKSSKGIGKKDANSNAIEVSKLSISALCSGIGTIQATELAVQTLRSKGYSVTDKEPLPEGEVEEDIVIDMDAEVDVDNSNVEGEENPELQKKEEVNGNLTIACSAGDDDKIPQEITASPTKKKKKRHQYIEEIKGDSNEEDSAQYDSSHMNEESTTDATSSLLVSKRSKSPKKKSSAKKNINIYHLSAESQSSPERSEYSSAFNDSETGSSFIGNSKNKDPESVSSSVEESNINSNMDKKDSDNNEDVTKTASTNSAHTSRYIKKCTDYDQPAFDDYMSKVYYQMVEDVEKYKVYHDIVNAYNISKSFLENKCSTTDVPCCGLMPAATSTVGDVDTTTLGETTYENTNTVTNTVDDPNSTFETNTLDDSISKENTTFNSLSADEEVEKRNEVEITSITPADNDTSNTDNNTTEREGCSPLPSPVEGPKSPLVNSNDNDDDGAMINNDTSTASKLKKQPSLNKKLFKGFKKVF